MRADLPSGTVTFLFTDVEGSTRLLQELGAEGYAAALGEHRRVLREAFGRHGGVEVDTQGDAFFVAFPTAPGAVAAAAELTEALEGGPIRVRAGVHTGTPLMTAEGYVGSDVHRAARIAAAGHGGQVLVSSSTVALVEPSNRLLQGRSLRDLGEHRFKDLQAPERVHQLGETNFPPLKSLYRTNLPVPATPFLGRERELAEVVEMLTRGDARLVSLTGPGGTGKTRLALQAAAEAAEAFPDGIMWVPLASLRDPRLVLSTVARVLDVAEETDRPLVETLAARLGGSRSLVLLDNAEHLLPQLAAELALLHSVPGTLLLVTSRERLQVQGEQVFPVPPLQARDGVALFLARARALDPAFASNGAIGELCARLDSLPLALELAAARTNLFSPGQLLERLGQRLDLLKGGRDTDPRHHTLRATITWSHDLLTQAEQVLFRRLGVFAGGCTYEAAEEVADATPDTLQSLLDKSLVRRRDTELGPRYWLLETVREYALEQLGEARERETLRQRHAQCFLRLAEESWRPLRGPEQKTWLRRLTIDEGNLRAALAWSVDGGHVEIALRLAHALEVFWIRAGRFTEATGWLDRVLALDSSTQPVLRARALATGGIFASGPDVAATRFDESIPVLRESGDEEGLAFALRGLGWLHKDRGEFPQARGALEEAVNLFEKLGHTVATRLCDLGLVAIAEGDLAGARRWLEQALAVARGEGDHMAAAAAIDCLGDVALAAGDVDEAERRYREALPIHVATHDFTVVDSMGGLAVTAASLGSLEEAGWLWGAAEQLARNHDAWVWPSLSDRASEVEERIGDGRDAFERGRDSALGLTPEEIFQRLPGWPHRRIAASEGLGSAGRVDSRRQAN
jgi:predicted ATPase/class 3 adenylate cyclase